MQKVFIDFYIFHFMIVFLCFLCHIRCIHVMKIRFPIFLKKYPITTISTMGATASTAKINESISPPFSYFYMILMSGNILPHFILDFKYVFKLYIHIFGLLFVQLYGFVGFGDKIILDLRGFSLVFVTSC